MAHQVIRDARRAVRAAVHRYPEIKDKAKQATNSDEWGPTDAQKIELASAAHHPEDFALIVRVCWKRIDDDTEYWMHVFKSLDVLEFLLMMRVPGIEGELKMHDGTIARLVEYHHAKHDNPERREQLNNKVRGKARKLLTLLHDEATLVEERDKVLRVMARIPGIDQQYALEHLKALSSIEGWPEGAAAATGSSRQSPEPAPSVTTMAAITAAAASGADRSATSVRGSTAVSPSPSGSVTPSPSPAVRSTVATAAAAMSSPPTAAPPPMPLTAAALHSHATAAARPAVSPPPAASFPPPAFAPTPTTTVVAATPALPPMLDIFDRPPASTNVAPPKPTIDALFAPEPPQAVGAPAVPSAATTATVPKPPPVASTMAPAAPGVLFDPFADQPAKPQQNLFVDFGARPPPAATRSAPFPTTSSGGDHGTAYGTPTPPATTPTSAAPVAVSGSSAATSAPPSRSSDPLDSLLDAQLSGLSAKGKKPSEMTMQEAMRHIRK